MIPACGQGALAIEVKEQDATLLTMINALANTHIDQEIQIERTFYRQSMGMSYAGWCALQNHGKGNRV